MKDLDFVLIKGDLNIEVNKIAYDSREVVKNSIFVAISGFAVDGHSFIDKAIEKGATTIIVEKNISIAKKITVLKVTDSREALANISANFYHHPTKTLNLIGITGTNGKTSVTYFIEAIFSEAKMSTGLIGTNGTKINNKLIKNKNTTPESLNLQQFFSQMVDLEKEASIIEVSSHALSLKRVAYCKFNIGIFTNLSPDHLEFHKNMEEYFYVKAELFELTKDFNIVNVDDEYGRKLINKIKKYDTKIITYGINNVADISASDIRYYADYSQYVVNTPKGSIEITVNIPGVIYVYNTLAAIACGYCNNIDLKVIRKGINNLKVIKGRLEVIYKNKDYKIIIDIAHTEDGLKKALTTLKPFSKGRIILVFGVSAAPEEKGREKCRAMGKVAATYADVAVVTSHNPKDHDPIQISAEIIEAIEEEKGSYTAIIDRKEAIEYAIDISKEDDIILIAGKGHQTFQAIGGEEIYFNEADIVADTLRRRDPLEMG